MATEILATVENGALMLDAALPFPDRTRVKLIVEPIVEEDPRVAAMKRFFKLCDEKPLPGISENFSREELYERD